MCSCTMDNTLSMYIYSWVHTHLTHLPRTFTFTFRYMFGQDALACGSHTSAWSIGIYCVAFSAFPATNWTECCFVYTYTYIVLQTGFAETILFLFFFFCGFVCRLLFSFQRTKPTQRRVILRKIHMTYVESISEVNVLVSNVARITRDTFSKSWF